MAGFDSLYTGITGLNSYQSWIDMISNNIANVDTTGFKGQSMTFADLFYQTQSFGSAPSDTSGGINGQQLGDGVQIASIDNNMAQGGMDTTGVSTNLAIDGDGFFILNNLNGSASPTYTRDGDFSLNANGVLYDPSSGLAVQGWEATNGVVTPGGTLGNITIPVGLSEQATATGAGTKVGPSTADSVFDVALGGNLDQTQWQQAFLNDVDAQAGSTSSSTSATASPYTVTTTFYDSLGNAHEATITYIPVAAGAVAATIAGLTDPSDDIASVTAVPSTATASAITVTVSASGATVSVSDGSGQTQTASAGGKVTIDGSTFTLSNTLTAGSQATYNVVAAQNGLPAEVQNASGTDVEPATRWAVDVSFTDGTTFDAITTPGTIAANGTVTAAQTTTASSGIIGYVYFDQNGQFINSSSIETADDAAGISGSGVTDYVHSTGVDPGTLQGNELNVTTWGTGAGNNASAPTGSGPAPATGAIGFDYSGDASLAGSYTATVVSQNGYPSGTLENITIGDDGTITGAFTNGENETLGQVAIARFQNEDGLTRIGSNQWEPSTDSGLAQVGVAGTGVYGSIQSGSLEESNVSLTTEFTNLIIAQRAFEANTKGIETADQNLQTLISLRASEN